MLIKICGLARREDAEAAVIAGADLLGFVFVPGTPRAVDAEDVVWVREMPIATVGVFRDAALETVRRTRDALHLDWVQLHGSESDSWLRVFGARTLRRLAVRDPFDWDRLTELSARCLPLIDPGGGGGRTFDWSVLADRPDGVRFGLAGGLTPANVAEAIRTARPDLVDVSSGVEAEPGVKDHRAIRDFVAAARAAV